MFKRTRHARDVALAKGLVVTAAAVMGLTALATPVAADGGDDPSRGSMYSVVDQIGARELWEEGFTGEGVTVAIVDTGVAPVDGIMRFAVCRLFQFPSCPAPCRSRLWETA